MEDRHSWYYEHLSRRSHHQVGPDCGRSVVNHPVNDIYYGCPIVVSHNSSDSLDLDFDYNLYYTRGDITVMIIIVR